MTETRYGIISDTHQDPRVIPLAIEVLKREGAQKLIANGDVGSNQDHIAFTFDMLGKSGLESFVQPGSHETLQDFESATGHFCEEYPNLINPFENPKVEIPDHHLVFLPGSDFLCGGQYQLAQANGTKSGIHKTNEGFVSLTNMNDLRKLVTHPDKTIVVSHIPRKFDDLEHGVDVAYFAENTAGGVMPGVVIEAQIRQQLGDVPYETIKQVAAQNGLTLKYENRGNEELRKLQKELGLTKGITGHFHEAVGRAHDSQCSPVQEGEFSDELFWNASHLDELKAGILTVKDGQVAYRNVDLRDYTQ